MKRLEMKSLARRGLSTATMLVLAFGLLTAQPAEAQPFACSAGLDVSPSYCRDTQPPCNPAAFANGMAVELIVSVANDSSYNSGATDPPAGNLSPGDTMKVFYACSSGTCNPGQELAGYFTYGSHTSLAGSSFVDDGNGYSGTITIDNSSIAWTAGVPQMKDLVTIQLTANEPPGTGVVFARAGQTSLDTSDNILSITDVDCIGAPLPGGGQGTTAGAFAPPPDNNLDSCDHPNKQIIKIDRKGSNDYAHSRVAFDFPGYDPSTCDLSFGYDNLGGGPFTFTALAPGDLTASGRCFKYKDKTARTTVSPTGAIQTAKLCPVRGKPDTWCLNIKAWGDFSSILTSDDMPLTVDTCGSSFVGPTNPPQQDPIWNTGIRTWILPRSVWLP